MFLRIQRKKENSLYKSLYIKEDLVKKIEEIAKINNTSFNNVVISMIEFCLLDDNDSINNDTNKKNNPQ